MTSHAGPTEHARATAAIKGGISKNSTAMGFIRSRCLFLNGALRYVEKPRNRISHKKSGTLIASAIPRNQPPRYTATASQLRIIRSCMLIARPIRLDRSVRYTGLRKQLYVCQNRTSHSSANCRRIIFAFSVASLMVVASIGCLSNFGIASSGYSFLSSSDRT